MKAGRSLAAIAALLAAGAGPARAQQHMRFQKAPPGVVNTAAARNLTIGPASGALLAGDFGCAACHTGLPWSGAMATRAPDLIYAGLKYQPGYLFRYLRDPGRVRRHIGRSRMPDFHLSSREALALTLYLERQTRISPPPPRWPAAVNGAGDASSGPTVLARHNCTGCHLFRGVGGPFALDLSRQGRRLRHDWMERFLAWPRSYDPQSPMPAFFYRPEGAGLRAYVAEPARQITALVDYIFRLEKDTARAQEDALAAARRANPDVNATMGGRIFAALDCAGCHLRSPQQAWRAGPDLAGEGARVRSEWLRGWLLHPTAIRPYGAYPGSGSRMPDFRLSQDDADSLAAYLMRLDGGVAQGAEKLEGSASLSGARRTRADSLLSRRAACLGCHALGGRGGRIGPDLSDVRSRLQRAYVRAVLADPRHLAPWSNMPRSPLDSAELAVLGDVLLRQRTGPAAQGYLDLTRNPILVPTRRTGVRELYGRACAPCHGIDGRGHGFDAPFLSVPPGDQADSSTMARRTDAQLFAAISGGGPSIGRSPGMPAFGQTLDSVQIRALVRYVRVLCGCRGPRDGRTAAVRRTPSPAPPASGRPFISPTER